MTTPIKCSEWSIDLEQQSNTEEPQVVDVDILLRIEGVIPSTSIREVYEFVEDLKSYLHERLQP